MGPTPAVAAVRRAVRETLSGLPADSCVLVACSGGADSVALAAALAFEAPRTAGGALRAGGVTVDHQLQDGSGERAAEVARLLTRLGLDPVESVAVDVAGPGGPEAAARAARYAALDAAARRHGDGGHGDGGHGAATILLGHTLDDQAETVLLGLARGSGTRSLAGMAAAMGVDERYRRPLLRLARSITRAACADERLPVWDDPHNADRAYARVRVRHDVMPALEKALGPGVAAALARTAELARADADALDGWARVAFAELAASPDEGIDAAELAKLPLAVRARVLRLAMLAADATPGSLSATHVGAAEALVSDWRGQGAVNLPGGVAVERRYGRLYLHGVDEHAVDEHAVDRRAVDEHRGDGAGG